MIVFIDPYAKGDNMKMFCKETDEYQTFAGLFVCSKTCRYKEQSFEGQVQ